MNPVGRALSHRAFVATVIWTLGLLYLGSVVHATESSLACPDWPTCFGTMMPEMTGGVFWEHLHRLVAGGLVLLFIVATYLAWREHRDRRWIGYASLAGVGLLLVQSVLGGVTVLMELPDAVSTSHLALAFAFLALAVVLATATSRTWGAVTADDGLRRTLRRGGGAAAALVFGQSVLGAVVRHTDSGMACPDVPLCLGEWVPPLVNSLITIHFAHRVVAVLTSIVVIAFGLFVLRHAASSRLRLLAAGAIASVVLQFALGIASVVTTLSVAPVSLHTLFAATLLALTVALATYGWEASPGERPRPMSESTATGATVPGHGS